MTAGRETVYEFRVRESMGRPGWWIVTCRTGSAATGEVVASVFGERRAEIVRDALSGEANESV